VAQIFISHSRSDKSVQPFLKILQRRHGNEFFSDSDSIEPGQSWEDQLKKRIDNSNLVVVPIGRDWLDDLKTNARRSFVEDRMVREIEEAFSRGKQVVPILIDGARLPSAYELPQGLWKLPHLNGFALPVGSSEQDVDELVRKIRQLSPTKQDSLVSQLLFRRNNKIEDPKPDPYIFISYRRVDSPGTVGRLYDRIRSRFGDGSVYMDTDVIPFGSNFKKHTGNALGYTRVLVSVVGARWVGPRRLSKPRIFETDDAIRLEIRTALAFKIPILPVLLDGASMPKASQVPADLADFTAINAAPLSSGSGFEHDAEAILRSIDELLVRR
jgi:hypothetical protein